MGNMELRWIWKTVTPSHIGGGYSRAGFADRTVRLEGGHAVLPSEAVKGAIRGSAEQLARWLGAKEEENEMESIPRITVLQRIFAPDETERYYRFCGCRSERPVTAYTYSSTKINPETRSAADNTLRTIEMIPGGLEFAGRIQLLAGDWNDSGSADYRDAVFLAAAVAATEGIGGKKGSGLGRLACVKLEIGNACATPVLTKADIFQTLETVLGRWGGKGADGVREGVGGAPVDGLTGAVLGVVAGLAGRGGGEEEEEMRDGSGAAMGVRDGEEGGSHAG